MKIQAIIFDWGRTLYESETKKEVPGAEEVLRWCLDKKLRLGLVSLVSAHANATLDERKKQIEISPLRKYFEIALVTNTDKDLILDEAVRFLNLPPEKILIVDDRVVRGIRYGNAHGHPTMWLRRGKFADELPNARTGQPTFIISKLSELTKLPIV